MAYGFTWVSPQETQYVYLGSSIDLTGRVNGEDNQIVTVPIYEDGVQIDTVQVTIVDYSEYFTYTYTPTTVGTHSLQYSNNIDCRPVTVVVTEMTNKVEIKTDIVTPLEEWFEQKSKKKTSWSSTVSDDNYPSEKLTKDTLDTKEASSNKVSSWSSTTNNTHYPSEKLVKDSLDGKLDKLQTSNKGKNVVVDSSSGNITFEDKPTIPTKTSDLTNDGSDGSNAFVSTNDSRLSDSRTPTSHAHGQITNDGKITSTAVTIASGDNILITDTSDSSKVKRVANLLTDHITDSTAHTNIGSSANATQSTINSNIDTALGNKADSSNLSNYVLTSKILSDISTATDNTQLVGAKELKDEIDALRGEVPTGVELTANKVSSWSGTTNNTHYPTEKLVKDSLDAKLDDSQLKTSISSSSSNTDIPSAKAVYDYVASVPKWTTQVASTLNDLPQSGSVGVFYLVPNSSGESQNAYDEYFWNGSAYEKFGTKTIDISNLVTLDDVLEYINNNGSLSLPTSGTDAGYLVFTVS